ncbi:drebrin-like protein B isoform X1 [Hydra vulgaris]|uniref:drebrin-like protein B isoform X1 n=1 Tax=Hydra vulgaris TaxID=6087 RepID=UPI00019246D7|nr:drebrin-like protein B [Hydra vulgaris]
MSVNLTKNKTALVKAWEDLCNPSSKKNWVLFGYDGSTFDLKVINDGEDGLEELVDDLSGGKILYAGLRVIDPNTNLPKIVFINWQGEGVPSSVKGKCANHLRDINGLFRGAHVQVNARSEDDVDEKSIMEKVKNASGANYSFHKEAPKEFVPQGQIGTNYEKKRPDKEIDIQKKNEFWSKTEKEERQRKIEEEKALEEQRMKESKLRAEREKKEEMAREAMIRERSKSIDEQRENTKILEKKKAEEERIRYQKTLKEAEHDDEMFKKRSEEERKKRLQEANKLIQSREESPKESFKKTEEPSSKPLPTISNVKKLPPAVQKKQPKPAESLLQSEVQDNLKKIKQEPEKRYEPVQEPVKSREPNQEPVKPIEPSQEPVKLREPSQEPVKLREPKQEPVKSREPNQEPVKAPAAVIQNQVTNVQNSASTVQNPAATMQNTATATPKQSIVSNKSNTAKALFDYSAADDTEITFLPGDLIINIEFIDDGWWRGTGPDGTYGLFPANYVELIEEVSSVTHEKITQPSFSSSTVQGSTKSETFTSHNVYDVASVRKAIALYDYQAVDETEISFDPNDIITHIEVIDEGWWRGMNPSGHYGLFPSNYVEEIHESLPSPKPLGDIRARALYDYQAADDSEITFDPDDVIINIEKIDEGWWKGMGPDGKIGLFPANYVELL